jgi:hypothetical protein
MFLPCAAADDANERFDDLLAASMALFETPSISQRELINFSARCVNAGAIAI